MSCVVNYLLLLNNHDNYYPKHVRYDIPIRLGYNILSNAYVINRSIKNKSFSQLINAAKSWQLIGNLSDIFRTCKCKSGLKIVARQLYQWEKRGIDAIKMDGFMFLRKGFELIRKYHFNAIECDQRCREIRNYNNNNINKTNDINAKNVFSTVLIEYLAINYNHNISKVYLVCAACATNDIMLRVNHLCALSFNCYSNSEYLIAWKLINVCYLLSGEYFISEELDVAYKQRDIMRETINKIRCVYCEKKAESKGKCKVCIGCMKKTYCSKKCQKRDWNEKHRWKCNKSWSSLYSALKITFFDRL
eukprot:323059_1